MRYRILVIILILISTLFILGNSKKVGNGNIVIKNILRVEIEKEKIFLGDKFVMKADPNGEVYILDYKSCKIYIYSKDGSFKTSIGEKGEGPGEFINPIDFLITQSKIKVLEFMMPTVHSFDKSNNNFINKKKLSLIKEGRIVSSIIVNNTKKVLLRVSYLDPKMNIIESVFLSNQNLTESLLIHKVSKCDLYNTEMIGVSFCGSNNVYYIAPRSKKKYQIYVYNTKGIFSHNIEKKNYIPIKKSTNQLKLQEEKIRKRKEKGLSNRYKKYLYKTAILQIVCDNKNRLWVLTPSENPEEETFKIDVFTNKGIFINSIKLKEYSKPDLLMSKKHLYIIEKDDMKNSSRFYVKYSIIEDK